MTNTNNIQNKAQLRVVDRHGNPLKDVFFQTGHQTAVTGNDGRAIIQYGSPGETVWISHLGLASVPVKMYQLLALEGPIVIDGEIILSEGKTYACGCDPEPAPTEEQPPLQPEQPQKKQSFIKEYWPFLAIGALVLLKN